MLGHVTQCLNGMLTLRWVIVGTSTSRQDVKQSYDIGIEQSAIGGVCHFQSSETCYYCVI